MNKSFLLNTGYRIIGEVLSENDTTIEMKNVAAYTFSEAAQGMSVSFGAFVPEAAGNQLTLYKSQVVASFDPDENIENHYKTLFGQIVTPASKLQLIN